MRKTDGIHQYRRRKDRKDRRACSDGERSRQGVPYHGEGIRSLLCCRRDGKLQGLVLQRQKDRRAAFGHSRGAPDGSAAFWERAEVREGRSGDSRAFSARHYRHKFRLPHAEDSFRRRGERAHENSRAFRRCSKGCCGSRACPGDGEDTRRLGRKQHKRGGDSENRGAERRGGGGSPRAHENSALRREG